jgi:hypothetical protein
MYSEEAAPCDAMEYEEQQARLQNTALGGGMQGETACCSSGG